MEALYDWLTAGHWYQCVVKALGAIHLSYFVWLLVSNFVVNLILYATGRVTEIRAPWNTPETWDQWDVLICIVAVYGGTLILIIVWPVIPFLLLWYVAHCIRKKALSQRVRRFEQQL